MNPRFFHVHVLVHMKGVPPVLPSLAHDGGTSPLGFIILPLFIYLYCDSCELFNCATVRCTIEQSGHNSMSFLIYLRFLGENPVISRKAANR